MAASASHEKLIKIWNIKNGEIVKSIDDNVGGSIVSLVMMKECNALVSAGYDKNLRIHDLKDFNLKKMLPNVHNDCIISLEKLN